MTKKNTIQVYMTEQEEESLKALAKSNYAKLSTFCRIILLKEVEKLNPEVATSNGFN